MVTAAAVRARHGDLAAATEPLVLRKTKAMRKMELRFVLAIEYELQREQRPPLQFHSGSYTYVRRRMVDSQRLI